MQTSKDLEIRFLDDVDQIARGFIDDYGLKHEEEVENLKEPLLRWLDFVSRYIPVSKRIVVRADSFPQNIPPDAKGGFNRIIALIEAGGDLNPFQSKGLIDCNDTSAAKRQKRTDLLWADWGIHHLHLSDAPILPGEFFASRSQWLLFCLVESDAVGLIDIRGHNQPDLFSDSSLIASVARSWPAFMAKFQINGVLPGARPNAEETRKLRQAGVSSFVEVDDKVYMSPGLGVTSASTPLRVSMTRNRIVQYVRALAKVVSDANAQFKQESAAAGVAAPEFFLGLTPQGLAVMERNQNKAFILPRSGSGFYSELHNLLTPRWAVDYLVRKAYSG